MSYTSARHRPHKTFDANLQMKDAGAITADAAAQVGGAAKVLDLGTGHVEGDLIIDVSALDATTGDETYNIIFQLCAAVGFGSNVVDAVSLKVTGVGRHVLPVRNEFNGTWYQYARLSTDVGGTTPSINYTAYLAKK